MNKKTSGVSRVVVLAFFASLLLPARALSYTVYFMNGSTMEVQSHRLQGDKVYLKMRSGEMAFDKAQLDLEKTEKDYKAYKDVMAKVEEMMAARDYAGAVKTCQVLAAGYPDDVRARYLYGLALTGAKRYDEALYALRRVQELDPSWPHVKTRLGDIYYRKGGYNDAIDQYLTALDEDPKDKEAHLGLGMCYAKQEMYEGAITELNKAIELRPTYADAYATLGYVFYRKSRYDEALESVNKALEMDSTLPEAHYYMGLVYGMLGVESPDAGKRRDYFDKSIEAFRRAVTIRRDYPEAHADLGFAFYKRGSVARAVEEFKTAIAQKPDMAIAHNNLAGIYLRQGFYEDAVSEAKKAVALEANMVEAYFIMGNAYTNMKMYKDAARAYDKYLYYAPDGDLSGEVRQRLDRVLSEEQGGGVPARKGRR